MTPRYRVIHVISLPTSPENMDHVLGLRYQLRNP